MRAIVCSSQDRGRFNAAVAASPVPDVLQSWEWGELKATAGWRALRLLIQDDDGRDRGACSVLARPPARGTPPILYAPRGPSIDLADGTAVQAVLDAIRTHAGAGFLFKCDPPVEAGSEGATALERAGLRRTHTGPFGGVQPIAVMVLDLSPDADKVFEGFKSKWRYNVRLAERKGVVVREGVEADLEPWYEILLETARRDGFVVRDRSYFQTMWKLLEPAGMLKMFVAHLDDRMIAGILCTAMGDRVIYNFGASSNQHRNVMPNHLIQWHAIRWAAQAGHRIYDFRGVSPVRDGKVAEQHIAGLNRFKEGFGARYVEYAGEFDLPLRRGWYALWQNALPVALKVRRRLRGAGAPEAME